MKKLSMTKKKEVDPTGVGLSAFADLTQKYYPLINVFEELKNADFSKLAGFTPEEKEEVMHDYLSMRHCSVKRELLKTSEKVQEMRQWLNKVLDKIEKLLSDTHKFRARQIKKHPDGVTIYKNKLSYTDPEFKEKIRKYIDHGHYRFNR